MLQLPPPVYEIIEGVTYMMVSSSANNWWDANDYCRDAGGVLGFIADLDILNDIRYNKLGVPRGGAIFVGLAQVRTLFNV